MYTAPRSPFSRGEGIAFFVRDRFHVKHGGSEKSSSVLAPLSGELPKAEGEALAVYFGMNIASVLGDTCSSR